MTIHNKHWNRKTYHRGILPERDLIKEFINAGECIICGKTLERNRYNNGKLEDTNRFYRRKTCGRTTEEGMKCFRKLCQNNGFSIAKKRKSIPEKEEQWRSLQSIAHTKSKNFVVINGRAVVRCKCIVCGKMFFVKPYWGKKRRTCGFVCTGKIAGAKNKIWCEKNRELIKERRIKLRKGKYKKCPVCKKEFYLHPAMAKTTRRFCSTACFNSTNRMTTRCIKCGKKFEIRKSDLKKVKRCIFCRKKSKIDSIKI